MKKILFILLLISGYAKAQLPVVPGFTNINQKYQWYQGIFYQRLSPPADTTTVKVGIALLNNVFYIGNGTYWTALASGSSALYTATQSVLKTGNNFTLENDETTPADPTVYGYESGARGWKATVLYDFLNPAPGDDIGIGADGSTLINKKGSGSFGDGVVGGGCQVIWKTGLTYTVTTPCVYNIAGGQYQLSAPADVTLATADATFPRQDAIYVSSSSLAGAVTGVAQANPEVPTVDGATQLFLTSAHISAGATTPTGVASLVVRDVNYAAGDWYMSRTATIDSIYATNPYHATLSVRLTAATNGQYFQYNSRNGVAFSKSAYNTLLLFVRNNSIFNNARNLQVRLYNGATQVGVALNLTTYGYSKTATGSYQTIAIPMSAFTGSDAFTAIRITNTGTGGTVDVQFDYVQLISGVTVTPPAASGLFGRTDIINSTGSQATFNQNALDFTMYNGNFYIGNSTGIKVVRMYAPDGVTARWQAETSVTPELIGGNSVKIFPQPGEGFFHIYPNTAAGFVQTIYTSSSNNQLGSIGINDPFLGGGERDFIIQPMGAARLKFNNIPDNASPDSVLTIKDGVVGRTATVDIGGGGGGSGLFPLTGTGTATGNVIGSLGTNTLDITGGSGSHFATGFGDGSTITNFYQDATSFTLSSSDDDEVIVNSLAIAQAGLNVSLYTGKTFVTANLSDTTDYVPESYVNKAYVDDHISNVPSQTFNFDSPTNGQILSYQDGEIINIDLPTNDVADSIRELASNPTTGNIYINTVTHRLRFRDTGAGFWYELAVTDSFSVTPTTDIVFNSTSGTVTESPTGTWTFGSSARASSTSQVLTGDGYIAWTIGDQNGFVVGLDNVSTLQAYSNFNYATFIAGGNLYAQYSGSNTSLGSATGITDLRIKRTGTAVILEKKVSGVWSTAHSYAASSTGDLYVTSENTGGGGQYLVNPIGLGF